MQEQLRGLADELTASAASALELAAKLDARQAAARARARLAEPTPVATIVTAVSRALGVAEAAIRSRSQLDAVRRARALAMLLALDAGHSASDVGRAMDRDHTTVLVVTNRLRMRIEQGLHQRDHAACLLELTGLEQDTAPSEVALRDQVASLSRALAQEQLRAADAETRLAAQQLDYDELLALRGAAARASELESLLATSEREQAGLAAVAAELRAELERCAVEQQRACDRAAIAQSEIEGAWAELAALGVVRAPGRELSAGVRAAVRTARAGDVQRGQAVLL